MSKSETVSGQTLSNTKVLVCTDSILKEVNPRLFRGQKHVHFQKTPTTKDLLEISTGQMT